MSDRIKKLEEKNKAVKKLQRQAALEYKKAERSYKAGSFERCLFLYLWSHLLICNCDRRKPKQNEPRTQSKRRAVTNSDDRKRRRKRWAKRAGGRVRAESKMARRHRLYLDFVLHHLPDLIGIERSIKV